MLKPVRIGELLRDRGLIDDEAFQAALARQRTLGGKLGEVLTSEGHLRPRDLYAVLAEQSALDYADLLACPPECALLQEDMVEAYLRYQCIPWQRRGTVLTFACVAPSESILSFMQQVAGEYQTEIALTTPRDIMRAVEIAFPDALDAHAREYLLHHRPRYSLQMKTPTKGSLRYAIAAALATLAVIFPAVVVTVGVMLCNLLYLVSLCFKLLLFGAGSVARSVPTPRMLTALPEDAELPIYTLLVPLYDEVEVIPQLLSALAALDYPKTRLDVKLIVEADDTRTLEALLAARPPAMCEVLRVPPSLPRTKPKACNYALRFARGEFVTIYDAEDIPAPDQLKKAVAAFRALPPEVICLQAKLNYYNRHENMLTRLFALEYSGLFDFMLPGLQVLGVPMPLGGTSNHLRLSKLRELGEWDPYNVTEDADLGVRLATDGHLTVMLDSQTEEEAPVQLSVWLKQRSRWIKGYMQTWRVAMRHAPELWRRSGGVGFAGFQLFVGASSLIYLMAPVLWVFSVLWLLGIGAEAAPALLAVQVTSVGVLSLGVVIQWGLAALTLRRAGWHSAGMALAVALFPFYWLLHSLASFRALWQLLFAPHFWDKTPHGLTRFTSKKTTNEA